MTEQDQKEAELSLNKTLFQVVIGFIFYGIVLFLPAGTVVWLEGWIFLGVSFLFVVFVVFYFWNRDPSIIRSRTSLNVKGWDALLVAIAGLSFFSIIILAGLNVRFNWTTIDPLFRGIALLGIIVGYVIIFYVMKENAFASKAVEIQNGQQVISTGPYKYVRHPMYSGFCLMAIGLPLVLNFLFGILLTLVFMVSLMIRSVYEEKVLKTELSGYDAYMEDVAYRIIPFIW